MYRILQSRKGRENSKVRESSGTMCHWKVECWAGELDIGKVGVGRGGEEVIGNVNQT